MSLRGSRRGLIAFAAVAVVSVIVIVMVVVAPWSEDGPADAPVAESSEPDFPARGDLADDTDLVEAAADAWRSGDSRDVRTTPTNQIELMWAGEVQAEALAGIPVDDETPDEVPVVVLQSGGELATFVVRGDDVDGLGIRELSSYPAPVVPLAGGLALAEDGLRAPADAADPTGSDVTVVVDDGLISSAEADSPALLLDGIRGTSGALRSGVYLDGRFMTVRDSHIERVWELLTDPDRAAATRSALSEAVGPRPGQKGARLELPRVEIVSELQPPDGDPVLVIGAVGTGAPWTRAVVAVEAAGPESAVELARLGYSDQEGAWVGSAWITSDDAPAYLVVAGGEGVERIEVRVGQQASEVTGAGIVVTDLVGTDQSLPDAVIAGYTSDGTVVAPLSD